MSSMLKKQSDLAQLADNLEKQTEAYTNAEYRYALAQNAFDKAYAIAYTTAVANGRTSVAAAEREADQETLSQKATLRLAEAAVKSHDRHWKAIDKRLSAAQSYYRFVRDQT